MRRMVFCEAASSTEASQIVRAWGSTWLEVEGLQLQGIWAVHPGGEWMGCPIRASLARWGQFSQTGHRETVCLEVEAQRQTLRAVEASRCVTVEHEQTRLVQLLWNGRQGSRQASLLVPRLHLLGPPLSGRQSPGGPDTRQPL